MAREGDYGEERMRLGRMRETWWVDRISDGE